MVIYELDFKAIYITIREIHINITNIYNYGSTHSSDFLNRGKVVCVQLRKLKYILKVSLKIHVLYLHL